MLGPTHFRVYARFFFLFFLLYFFFFSFSLSVFWFFLFSSFYFIFPTILFYHDLCLCFHLLYFEHFPHSISTYIRTSMNNFFSSMSFFTKAWMILIHEHTKYLLYVWTFICTYVNIFNFVPFFSSKLKFWKHIF